MHKLIKALQETNKLLDLLILDPTRPKDEVDLMIWQKVENQKAIEAAESEAVHA